MSFSMKFDSAFCCKDDYANWEVTWLKILKKTFALDSDKRSQKYFTICDILKVQYARKLAENIQKIIELQKNE